MTAELHIWEATLGEFRTVFYADTSDLLEATKVCLERHDWDGCPAGLALKHVGQFCDDQPLLRPEDIGELCQEFDWVHGQHNEDPWEGLALWQWIAARLGLKAVDADTYINDLFETRRKLCPRCRTPKPEHHRCAKHGCQCLHCNTEASECPTKATKQSSSP